MQVRIRAENPAGNVEGLPSPRVDLVFEKDGTHGVILYFVDPAGVVPEYGPRPPCLQVCIEDLCAVVAALKGIGVGNVNVGVTHVQMSADEWDARMRQLLAEAVP